MLLCWNCKFLYTIMIFEMMLCCSGLYMMELVLQSCVNDTKYTNKLILMVYNFKGQRKQHSMATIPPNWTHCFVACLIIYFISLIATYLPNLQVILIQIFHEVIINTFLKFFHEKIMIFQNFLSFCRN